MEISTEPNLLDVPLSNKVGFISESPSTATFLQEEDVSMCPLLPTTPSPPLTFSHPLTPNCIGDENSSINESYCGNGHEDTTKVVDGDSSSTGSSSGIVMDVNDNDAAKTFFNSYQHLKKNDSNEFSESDMKSNGLYNNISIHKDTPSFVSWNWPLIRKCTFFIFISGLLGIIGIIIAMILVLPSACNPKNAWYRGSVFYEIFPASFQDSEGFNVPIDGVGDFRGIGNRIDYFEKLGIGAIRLNSIFTSPEYPYDYENVTDLMEIASQVGTDEHFKQLALTLHDRNMSLVLDLEIYPFINNIKSRTNFTTFKQNEHWIVVVNAMHKWLNLGCDGFYIKGLENYINDPNMLENIREWKNILGSDRVLIVSQAAFDVADESLRTILLNHIDLVDIHLNISSGTDIMEKRIKSITNGMFTPEENGIWIHWSLGGVNKIRISNIESSKSLLAAIIMQLMLPGTPSIFYGDEIGLREYDDPNGEHNNTKHLHHLSSMQWSSNQKFTDSSHLPWMPVGTASAFNNLDDISKMIKLRKRSPSIYKNSITKELQNFPNTNIRHSQNDIILIERIYPRRNSFVSISNFGLKNVSIDLSSLYYSGYAIIGYMRTDKIYFNEFEIGPLETIVVKLDK